MAKLGDIPHLYSLVPILKVHGCVTVPEKTVLSKSDYFRAPDLLSSCSEKLLQEASGMLRLGLLK